MKHLLNNLSEEEKNSIREQHTGGMKVNTENFRKLVKTKQGNVKLISESKMNISPEEIIEMLLDSASAFPQTDYDDPYDWMQDVFSSVELELDVMGVEDEIIGDIRMLYDDVILDLWEM